MAFCTSCGTQNKDDNKFCDSCGAQIGAQQPAGQPQNNQPQNNQQQYTQNAYVNYNPAPPAPEIDKKYKTMCIIGVVVNALALCCYCAGVPGLVCGIIGMVMAKNPEKASVVKAMAIISLVLGGLTLIIGLLGVLLGGFASFMQVMNEFEYYY